MFNFFRGFIEWIAPRGKISWSNNAYKNNYLTLIREIKNLRKSAKYHEGLSLSLMQLAWGAIAQVKDWVLSDL